MEHFEETIWRWDPRGKREYKLLELRNPNTKGLHVSGLHPPQGMRYFSGALSEVSDSQTIDEQWYQDKDTWVTGCPISPDWDSDIDVGIAGEETSDCEIKTAPSIGGLTLGDDTSLLCP